MAALAASLQWGRDQMIAEMQAVAEEAVRGCVASMGPRSDDRGNVLGVRPLQHIGRMLQWGRDQMIAEIAEARVALLEKKLLQWGRD